MENEEFCKRLYEVITKSGKTMSAAGYDMGKSHDYMGQIVRGARAMKIPDFLLLCKELNIRPVDFFDEEVENPGKLYELILEAKPLSDRKIEAILKLIRQ